MSCILLKYTNDTWNTLEWRKEGSFSVVQVSALQEFCASEAEGCLVKEAKKWASKAAKDYKIITHGERVRHWFCHPDILKCIKQSAVPVPLIPLEALCFCVVLLSFRIGSADMLLIHSGLCQIFRCYAKPFFCQWNSPISCGKVNCFVFNLCCFNPH